MFTDCDVQPINFYNGKKLNLKINEAESQTEFDEQEQIDEEIQVIERESTGTQINMKEMMVRENLDIDDRKLETFLKSVKIINLLTLFYS